jgi:hypothetical protein
MFIKWDLLNFIYQTGYIYFLHYNPCHQFFIIIMWITGQALELANIILHDNILIFFNIFNLFSKCNSAYNNQHLYFSMNIDDNLKKKKKEMYIQFHSNKRWQHFPGRKVFTVTPLLRKVLFYPNTVRVNRHSVIVSYISTS